MKKNTFKILEIIAIVAIIGFSMTACDMENTGYLVEYYEITSSTYSALSSINTADEQLKYVKNATGASKKRNFWTTSFDAFKDKIYEISGASLTSDISSRIQGQYITALRTSPGLINWDKGYWFFYIQNNNNIGKGDVQHKHTCSFDTTWHFNETQHWKECSCGKKDSTANHSFFWSYDSLSGGICYTCDYVTGINGLPSGAIAIKWGVNGFTLPAGVTVNRWYEYYGMLYIIINADTDIRSQIITQLIENGWALPPVGSTQYRKPGLRVAVSYYSSDRSVWLQIMTDD